MSIEMNISVEDLACPETGKTLSLLSMEEAIDKVGASLVPLRGASSSGAGEYGLLRDDNKIA